MKVYTSPEDYERELNAVTCFLAGGISNCKDWQSEVIKELEKYPNTDKLVLFNPRRDNFPINDPTAAEKQITWEFNMLNNCDIFSMYFDGGESIQPICLYELGRHLAIRRSFDVPVISIEDGYKRTQDVLIQSKLAKGNYVVINTSATPEMHAKSIYEEYLKRGGCPYHEVVIDESVKGVTCHKRWCNKNNSRVTTRGFWVADCDKCEECKKGK